MKHHIKARKNYENYILWHQSNGRLQILTVTGYNSRHNQVAKCRCDCGKIKELPVYRVITEKVKSCGCIKSEKLTARNTTHGHSKTRLYRIWDHMRQRCHNPRSKSYKDYGGRGITVCAEWESFDSFRSWSMANGYNDALTIDRIDNNGNYCPENCRFISNSEQQRNKRNNHLIQCNGLLVTIAEASEITGINREVLRARANKTTETARVKNSLQNAQDNS